MTLKEICSWCKEVIREGDAPADAPVSHGCCKKCLRKHFPLIADEVEGTLEDAS